LSVYVIGPEGGFSQRELAVLHAAGFAPASLGKRVLRCETAAALCLGLHWWASHLNGTATGNAAQ
ncbi:MAG: RsmE family RNA methyltransferase, partial [Desulfovibrio sp.]|nr:RsmE family RNA methyltransferase [Desulfovibrio sp.]